MNGVYSVSTTTGVNPLAPTQDLMILSMQTTSSHRSKRGMQDTVYKLVSCEKCYKFSQMKCFSLISCLDVTFVCNNYKFWSCSNNRCNLAAVVAEVDRILRPEGKLIVRDDVETIGELENMFKSMKWEVRLTYSKDKEGLFCVQKSMWRPSESEMVSYAIA